jgi:glycosyltransferase involved in cell wall biosynthesis
MQGGGIESMVCSLANEMAKEHEIVVCSIKEPDVSDIFWGRLHERVQKVSLHKKKRLTFFDLYKVFKFIKEGSFDVVNLHGFFYYYVVAVLLLHTSVKFVYTVHSDASKENQVLDKYLVWLKRICFHFSWMIPITISKESEKSFYDLYHCHGNIIYNGIPTPMIVKRSVSPIFDARISENTLVFFHAGRIDKVKNQYVLCKCIRSLIKKGLDIALVIAGKRQYEDAFKLIEPFFSERILYIGERSDIPQLMSEADAMCLSSIYEGLPVTLLESLAVGCVPICTPVGGIVNVIQDGYNGFLSKSIEESDYYDAIMKFIQLDANGRKHISNMAKNSFSNYTISSTVEQYIRLYQS